MTLSKTQHDLLYDTISQSSPNCLDEEKIKKLEAWSLEKVIELLQAFLLVDNIQICIFV